MKEEKGSLHRRGANRNKPNNNERSTTDLFRHCASRFQRRPWRGAPCFYPCPCPCVCPCPSFVFRKEQLHRSDTDGESKSDKQKPMPLNPFLELNECNESSRGQEAVQRNPEDARRKKGGKWGPKTRPPHAASERGDFQEPSAPLYPPHTGLCFFSFVALPFFTHCSVHFFFAWNYAGARPQWLRAPREHQHHTGTLRR